MKKNNVNELLVAHRGFSTQYPENTMAAINGAINANAKYIEIDIQLTKDKQAVLFHDRDLERLCEKPKSIHDYTLDQLNAFSSFSPDRFKSKFKGERIPSLNEVVELFKKHPSVILFVELKRISIDVFSMDDILNAVIPLISPIKKQCVFISFSLDIIERIRQQTNNPVGAVIDDWNEAVTTQFDKLKKINPEYFFCDITLLPQDKKLKLLNSKIVVYECTDYLEAIAVLKQGVDMVETFDIKSMSLALQEHMK